jgi:hypothetical protein
MILLQLSTTYNVKIINCDTKRVLNFISTEDTKFKMSGNQEF